MTTPTANVLRTLVQAFIAVCLAIPSALALVPIPSKYDATVALVVGLAAAAVVIVTAVQNAFEARAGVALFRSPQATDVTSTAGTSSRPAGSGRSNGYTRGPP